LLAATLLHLDRRRDECPKTFVITHFHEILSHNLLKDCTNIQFMMMNILRQPASSPLSHGLEQIIFLYKLVHGSCLQSYGFKCAELAGLPEAIILRARHVSQKISFHQPVDALQAESSRFASPAYASLFQAFGLLDLDGTDDELLEFIQQVQSLPS